MTGGVPMRRNRKKKLRLYDLRSTVCCVVFMLLAATQSLQAQDMLPGFPRLQEAMADCDTLCSYGQRTDTVTVPFITFPATFRELKENEITDSLGILRPFWENFVCSVWGLLLILSVSFMWATAIFVGISFLALPVT